MRSDEVYFDGRRRLPREALQELLARGVHEGAALKMIETLPSADFAEGKWVPSTYKRGPRRNQPCERHSITGKCRDIQEGAAPAPVPGKAPPGVEALLLAAASDGDLAAIHAAADLLEEHGHGRLASRMQARLRGLERIPEISQYRRRDVQGVARMAQEHFQALELAHALAGLDMGTVPQQASKTHLGIQDFKQAMRDHFRGLGVPFVGPSRGRRRVRLEYPQRQDGIYEVGAGDASPSPAPLDEAAVRQRLRELLRRGGFGNWGSHAY